MTDDRAKLKSAADDVLALRPDRWVLLPPLYDPGTGSWSCTAHGPRLRGGGAPESITGTGDDKLAALSDLAIQLERRRAVTPTARVTSYSDLRGYGYVRVRGVNLGTASNVGGCANFVVFVGAFLACSALVVLVSAIYEAGVISPEVVRGFENVGFLLSLAFLFGIPIVVVLLASPRIERWVASHADRWKPPASHL